MYIAKAAVVSGTKVFADGKWLTCIGNKRVRAGDYIWTDGRCVYGNKLISQQPLVITSNDDKAIPILSFRKGYSLTTDKKQLKYIEMPDITYKNFSKAIMINDERNVFLYNEEPVIVEEKEDESEDYKIFERLLTANILNGNHYYMVLNYKKYDNADEEYSAIKILKNGEVVQTFNLEELINETYNKCEMPPQVIISAPTSQQEMTIFDYSMSEYFIEDESHWQFIFIAYVDKELSYELTASTYDGSHEYEIAESFGQTFNVLNERILVQPKKKQVLFSSYVSGKGIGMGEGFTTWGEPPNITYEETTYPDLDDAIFWMHDGCYYKLKPYHVDFIADGQLYEKSFYGPTGNKLFSTNILIGNSNVYVPDLIYKEKNGYIALVTNRQIDGFDIRDGLLFCREDGTIIQPAEEENIPIWLNHRLRPIKKYKGWQNRIKKITLERE